MSLQILLTSAGKIESLSVSPGSDDFERCFEEEACSLWVSDPSRVRITFQFENWVQSAKLTCETEHYRDTAKTYYLIGTVVTIFIVLVAVDFIGRKNGFYCLFATTCAGMTVAVVVPNINIRIAGLGVAIAAYPLFFSLYMIFFTETLRRQI